MNFFVRMRSFLSTLVTIGMSCLIFIPCFAQVNNIYSQRFAYGILNITFLFTQKIN